MNKLLKATSGNRNYHGKFLTLHFTLWHNNSWKIGLHKKLPLASTYVIKKKIYKNNNNKSIWRRCHGPRCFWVFTNSKTNLFLAPDILITVFLFHASLNRPWRFLHIFHRCQNPLESWSKNVTEKINDFLPLSRTRKVKKPTSEEKSKVQNVSQKSQIHFVFYTGPYVTDLLGSIFDMRMRILSENTMAQPYVRVEGILMPAPVGAMRAGKHRLFSTLIFQMPVEQEVVFVFFVAVAAPETWNAQN